MVLEESFTGESTGDIGVVDVDGKGNREKRGNNRAAIYANRFLGVALGFHSHALSTWSLNNIFSQPQPTTSHNCYARRLFRLSSSSTTTST